MSISETRVNKAICNAMINDIMPKYYGDFVSFDNGKSMIKYPGISEKRFNVRTDSGNGVYTETSVNAVYIDVNRCLENEQYAEIKVLDIDSNMYKFIFDNVKVYSCDNKPGYASYVYRIDKILKYLNKKKTDKFTYAVIPNDWQVMKIYQNDSFVGMVCPIRLSSGDDLIKI